MSLRDEVIETMELLGYTFDGTKGFYEDYNSTEYVMFTKVEGNVKMITRYGFCSCDSLHEVTVSDLVRALKPITEKMIKDFASYASYNSIKKDEQSAWLSMTFGFIDALKSEREITITLIIKEEQYYVVERDDNGILQLILSD